VADKRGREVQPREKRDGGRTGGRGRRTRTVLEARRVFRPARGIGWAVYLQGMGDVDPNWPECGGCGLAIGPERWEAHPSSKPTTTD
jgi:hypothetical protein